MPTGHSASIQSKVRPHASQKSKEELLAAAKQARPEDGEIVIQAPLCAIFRRYLKQQGLKFTSERAAILNTVLDTEGVFEAEELLEEMKNQDIRASKATVYRTLKHLVEAGIIREVLLDSKFSHYELSYGRKPKGHLVCVETGQVLEFEAPEMEVLRDRICRELGFDPLSHRFVIYGLSPEAKAQSEVAEEEASGNA